VQQAAGLLADGTAIVLSGDVPLVEGATLRALLAAHREGEYAATLLSTRLPDPTGYGRIVRGPAGDFRRIVEHRDATPAERALDEINAGIYAFETVHLLPALARLSTGNAQGEYYLTDVLGALVDESRRVGVLLHEVSHEVLGINSRVDLAESEALLRRRTLERLMVAGVTIIDPAITYADDTVEVGRDTTIHPGAILTGATTIGENCEIGAYCQISDATLADGVTVRAMSVVERARIARGAIVGPFARLRPGAVLGDDTHVGNFVEVKNSTLGAGSKANHLTYLGDAEIGAGCNIGAGTITCNYDGKNKHRTTIEDDVYIGSDTMLVAPVRVGRGSKTGAGAVVTHDVPEDSLAVGVPARVVRKLTDD
jgi:bifunctional UDP-N-acetylglucosamine pyrophosphorylase/glucosamine-1-phosphate N-acetyltransferase